MYSMAEQTQEEKEHFNKYYSSYQYCKHNQPCYAKCYRCAEEKQVEQMKRWYKKEKDRFNEFINTIHGFIFILPDPERMNKVKVREDDKFKTLKKSSSQEELRKEYHKLAKVYHPDKKDGDTKLMQKLSQLYDILKYKFI
tara:strand:+ start:1023 stop:1442 length:420 start_codon:yes stop_codon:yes gene_type:complete